MLLWDDEQLAKLDAALDQARSGQPTTLTVLGDAGTGKTSLLDELAGRAEGFRLMVAEGLETVRVPFSTLAQLGVDPPQAYDDGVGDPFVAAQALRDRVDELGQGGPVMVRLDDLHWADPESVDTLLWLLRRASGDRLLVAVGTRPLSLELHNGWQRWSANRRQSEVIRMDGLSATDAARLAEHLRPGITAEVTERLRAHTSGNPLYLTALLDEYEVPELVKMRVLPAPAEFAKVLATRVSRLSRESVRLLRALSVLGTGWAALPDVAAVGELTDVGSALQELLDDSLVELRAPQGAVSLRVTHALTQAAVYQHIPIVERRRLHGRAATVVRERGLALEHRMAAAEQYDDDLASAMADYAGELYQQHSFRVAAQNLRWSSALTRDPSRRERRWLDSLFYSVMALDVSVVHDELDQVSRASDGARRALVIGGLAVWERRFHDGIPLLEQADARLSASTDQTTRYRIEVLLAWARMAVGRPPEEIIGLLERASVDRVPDGGLDGTELVTAGGTGVRMQGFEGVLASPWVAPVPRRAADTPLELTKQLTWRGAERMRLGHYDEAAEDLSEGIRRIQNGVTDFGRGAFHASLAAAQWMRGEWVQARLTARLALDFSSRFNHPMVLALTALPAIGFGNFEEADDLIARAEAILTQASWWEACQLLVVSKVSRAHAGTSQADRAGLLDGLRATPFEFADLNHTSPMLRLHLCLAALWADQPNQADRYAGAFEASELRARWRSGAVLWLRGLIAEARGFAPQALADLGRAAEQPDNLPLHHAHMLVDYARLAAGLGRGDISQGARQRAEALYARLGAAPYLDRLATTEAGAARHRNGMEMIRLTERERDVLTLAAAGMSYAQISRELFITQSTVSYHLSNMYDKAGVRRRHQLTDLFRREPERFGTAVAG